MVSPTYHVTPDPAKTRTAEITPDKVAAAMHAFFRIMEAWNAGTEEARVLLGRPSRSTFFNWKKGETRTVPHDTVRRLSYVLGIYKALQVLFKAPAQADAWVRRPNDALGGQSALERMLGGDVADLADVRRFLDSVRGHGL